MYANILITGEIDKFPERQKLPKLIQEEMENLNRPIKTKQKKKIRLVIEEYFLQRKESYIAYWWILLIIKEKWIPVVHKLFRRKIEQEGIFPDSFYEVCITLILRKEKEEEEEKTKKTTDQYPLWLQTKNFLKKILAN